MIEFGGPDGGDGGNGGHVVFRATPRVSSLADVSSFIGAENGISGRSEKRHGKNAPHKYVDVPLGTIFRQEIAL